MSKEMGSEILISSLPAIFPNAIDVYQKAQKIYQNVKDIGTQFGKVTEAIKTIPSDVRALYGSKVNQIEALIKEGGAENLAKAKSLYGDLQQTVQKAATTGKSIVTSSANQMTDLAKSTVEKGKEMGTGLIEQGKSIVNEAQNMASGFLEQGKSIVNEAQGKLGDLTSKAQDLLNTANVATQEGLNKAGETLNSVKDNFTNLAKEQSAKIDAHIQNIKDTVPVEQQQALIKEAEDSRTAFQSQLSNKYKEIKSNIRSKINETPETKTVPTPEPAPTPVAEPTRAPEPAPTPIAEPTQAPVRQVFPAYDEEGIQSAPRNVSYENARPVTSEPRPLVFKGPAIGESAPITRAEKEAQRQQQINADRDEAMRISMEPTPKTIVSRTNVSRTANENIGRSQNLTEVSDEFPLRQQLLESTASKDLNIFSETGIKQSTSNIFKSSGLDNPFSQLAKEKETILNKPTTPYITDAASETIIGRAKTAVSKIPTITEETTAALPEVSSSLLSKLGSGIGGVMDLGAVTGGVLGTFEEAKGNMQSTAQKLQTGLGQEQALEIASQRGAQVVQAGKQALAGGEQLASKAGEQLQQGGKAAMDLGKQTFGQTEQVVSKAATELQAQGEQLANKAQSTIDAGRGAVSDLVENVGAKSSDLLTSFAEKGALETLGEITGISAIPVVGEVAALGGLIYGAISGIEDLFSHTSSKPTQPLPQAPVTAGIVHQAGL